MKSTALMILTVSIAVIFFLPLAAMGEGNSNYLTVKAGTYSPTGDLDDSEVKFDTGFNGEIAIGHYYTPNFALEGGIGYFQSDSDTFIGFPADNEVWFIPLTITAKGIIPLEFGKLYGGIGIGVYYGEIGIKVFGLSDDDTDVVLGGHIVAGANFDISPTVFLGVEGKYTITDEAEVTLFDGLLSIEGDLDGLILTANLGFRF